MDCPSPTVPALVAERVQRLKILGRSQLQISTVKIRLEKFARFYNGEISDLKLENVENFLVSLNGVSARTRNNYISEIRGMVNFAVKRKQLPKSFDELDGLEKFTEERKPVEIYTPDELRRMLRYKSRRAVSGILIQAFAGVRTAEMLRLGWTDVNFERRLILVAAEKAKTRARRFVEISPNLEIFLRRICPTTHFVEGARCPDTRLFDATLSSYVQGLSRVLRAASVTPRRNALRHSFISYRLALTGDENLVASEAGTSPKMIHANYRESVTRREAEEWFSIEPESEQMEFQI